MIEIEQHLYSRLIAELARDGGGSRESGAFLLGHLTKGIRRVEDFLLYSVIAPQSIQRGAFVSLSAEEMGRAWDYCFARHMEVVADVHTHPFGPAQSLSDRAHPIVSVGGHVALIVPNFALNETEPVNLGVHTFLGSGRWRSAFGSAAATLIRIRK